MNNVVYCVHSVEKIWDERNYSLERIFRNKHDAELYASKANDLLEKYNDLNDNCSESDALYDELCKYTYSQNENMEYIESFIVKEEKILESYEEAINENQCNIS